MSKSHPFTPSESALVLIDLANDFVYAGGVIADAGGADYQKRAQSILPALGRLVDAARKAGVAVVYATDAHTNDDSELAMKWPPHAMKGTKWAEIVPALKPKAGDVVLEKTTYSPFVSSEIDAELRARGIKQLYITGLHTDCCARHTSGDAFQRGYDLVWITDALQAFTDEQHQQGLEYFKAWYANDSERQLKTTDQVIGEWSKASKGVKKAVAAVS